jgi:hypothetical protein
MQVRATHDRLKAAPGTTIREAFEGLVERRLNLARYIGSICSEAFEGGQ